MAMVISCAVWAGRRVAEECNDETDRRGVMIFVAVEVVAAVIHASFAFYIQRRLVARLEQAATSAEVAASAKHLLTYDIGFCLYFFFAIAVCGYNGYSLTLLSCPGATPILLAAWLMFTHGGFSVCYLCCFLCGHSASAAGASAKAKASAPRTITVPGPTAPSAPPAAKAGEP
jgi:uncharacterized protein with PQ loop repeat